MMVPLYCNTLGSGKFIAGNFTSENSLWGKFIARKKFTAFLLLNLINGNKGYKFKVHVSWTPVHDTFFYDEKHIANRSS